MYVSEVLIQNDLYVFFQNNQTLLLTRLIKIILSQPQQSSPLTAINKHAVIGLKIKKTIYWTNSW